MHIQKSTLIHKSGFFRIHLSTTIQILIEENFPNAHVRSAIFNGEIITYTIGNRPTFSLVSEMLNKALARLPEEHELMMHSDQGWHIK